MPSSASGFPALDVHDLVLAASVETNAPPTPVGSCVSAWCCRAELQASELISGRPLRAEEMFSGVWFCLFGLRGAEFVRYVREPHDSGLRELITT